MKRLRTRLTRDQVEDHIYEFFNFIVPKQHRTNPLIWIRCVIVQLLPVVYLVAMYVSLPAQFSRLRPPLWLFSLYGSFPFMLRLFGTYKVPAWVFILVQLGTSVYLALLVNSKFAYVSTAYYIPLVALLFVGYGKALAISFYVMVFLIAGHVGLIQRLFGLAQPLLKNGFSTTYMLNVGMARNFLMVIFMFLLHYYAQRLVTKRAEEIERRNQQIFASVWYVWFGSCISIGVSDTTLSSML